MVVFQMLTAILTMRGLIWSRRCALGIHICQYCSNPRTSNSSRLLKNWAPHSCTKKTLRYIEESGGTLDAESVDFLIHSKVLPKLRGTEQQLRKPLEALAAVCTKHSAARAGGKVAHMLAQLDES